MLLLLRVLVVAPTPWLFKIFIDESIAARDIGGVLTIGALIIGLLLLHLSVGIMGVKKLACSTTTIMQNLRGSIFERMQNLSFSFIDNCSVGRLVSKYSADTQKIQETLLVISERLIPDIIYGATTLIVLIFLDWKLAITVFMLLPVFYFANVFLGRALKKDYHSVRLNNEELTGVVSEHVSALRLTKSLGTKSNSTSVISQKSATLAISHKNMLGTQSVFWTTMYVFKESLGLIVIAGGSILVILNQTSIGTLVAYLAALPIILLPIESFTAFTEAFYKGEESFQSIKEIFDDKNAEMGGTSVISPISGDISINNITFAYPSKPKDLIFKSLTLNIKAGERVALVGSSGSGKTTLVNLILGLYKIEQGSIFIDGVNLIELSLESFRKQCAIVMQETILFSGSIIDNIRLGKPQASEQEIYEAARIANAEEFISKLPRGYSTIVGEGGVGLSGGQKQRISIARAILRNPQILVLDEATSALDEESEYMVQEALNRLTDNRTVITIAHRLETIKNSDRIIVLGNGKILEEGTYEQLYLSANDH